MNSYDHEGAEHYHSTLSIGEELEEHTFHGERILLAGLRIPTICMIKFPRIQKEKMKNS